MNMTDVDSLGRIEELDKFPGFARVGDFIKSIIIESNSKAIGDVGGGRLPAIDLNFVRKHGLTYHLFDIAADELARADSGYEKIQIDVTCSDAEFASVKRPGNFDLIFSHMVLELLQDPLQAHRNFFKMLRPGGLSVHKNSFTFRSKTARFTST